MNFITSSAKIQNIGLKAAAVIPFHFYDVTNHTLLSLIILLPLYFVSKEITYFSRRRHD